MASRCRGYRSRRLQAFHDDPQLLIIGPAPPSARLDHLKPFNLSTVLMAIHKHCYTSLNPTQQGGPRRRETDRTTIVQKKTDRPVQFEITEQTRVSIEVWLRTVRTIGSRYLFPSRLHAHPHLSTRQYARLVHRWVDSIGLEPASYGTHSLRRTKATQIYRKTGNLRAVQLLLGRATYCPRTTG